MLHSQELAVGLTAKGLVVNAVGFVEYSLGIGAIELIPGGRMLKSGRISPYFFNSGLFCTGESLQVLAESYAYVISQLSPLPDVLFGPAYKGISIVAATAVVLWSDYSIRVGYAHDRKEEKDHGEGGVVVGHPLSGQRVLLLDDVMTTGGSLEDALHTIERSGGYASGCVIAFDRRERVSEQEARSATQVFAETHSLPVYAVADLDDLIDVLVAEITRRNILHEIAEYQEAYGT